MAEYIKKADAKKEIIRFSTEEGSNTVCSKLYCDIGLMPTIDIVHCNDCKYFCTDDGLYCSELLRETRADWFCADGERRTDG